MSLCNGSCTPSGADLLLKAMIDQTSVAPWGLNRDVSGCFSDSLGVCSRPL
jgi:hypothetical protein